MREWITINGRKMIWEDLLGDDLDAFTVIRVDEALEMCGNVFTQIPGIAE